MKTFDIENFNKQMTLSPQYEGFYLEDSTYIKQFAAGGEGKDKLYVEFESPPSPALFQTYRVFYYNGKLKLEGLQFPNDFEKGIWREYDEQGNLIKETNYDEPFKFSFEDILHWIEERDIDMKAFDFRIARGIDDYGKPGWDITWERADKKGLRRAFIDGITGEIEKEFDQDYPIEE
ncbi:hypothetical protein [Xanthovirga aplysinae]|uniref:hypothetical protein n=1 Tax=Xanthovirga aplysinae TaxID=2529853 RepID=UPI001CA434D2|nr:hypothetical protein [Xanthovirga aplysinae]